MKSTGGFGEAQWEQLALEALAEREWRPLPGRAIVPGSGERESWDELVIPSRLLAKLRELNPGGRQSRRLGRRGAVTWGFLCD